MLPPDSRLKITSRTSRDWKNKQEFFTPEFKFTYTLTDQNEKARFGFIVSGKIGKAAQRNKARRLFTEAVRERIDKFPPGSQAILIANKQGTFSKKDIDLALEKVIDKLFNKSTNNS